MTRPVTAPSRRYRRVCGTVVRAALAAAATAGLVACGGGIVPLDGGDAAPEPDATTPLPPLHLNWVSVSDFAPSLIAGTGPSDCLIDGRLAPVGAYVVEAMGACVVGHLAGGMQSVSGGTLLVTAAGASARADPASTTQLDNYNGDFPSATACVPGVASVFEATGDVVPAFGATTVFPPTTTLRAPIRDANRHLAVQAATGLALSWDRGPPSVRVVFETASPAEWVVVVCTFPGVSGNATVPAAVLSELAAYARVTMEVSAADVVPVTAGAFPIDVVAQEFLLDSTIIDFE